MPNATGDTDRLHSTDIDCSLSGVHLRTVGKNVQGLQQLDESIRRRSADFPFGPHVILVDSLAIGRNVLAGLAEVGGMAVGVETIRMSTLLQRIVEAVHDFDGKGPTDSSQPLCHQSLALAIIAAIPQLTDGTASEHIQDIAKNLANAATVSKQLNLASELARSFDYAFQKIADPAALSDPVGVEPWVSELYDGLSAFAASDEGVRDNGRLAAYLNQHQTNFFILERLATDKDLLGTLRQRRILPETLYAFDLTISEGSPEANTLFLLSRLTNLEFFLIDPSGLSQKTDPVVGSWVTRSTKPQQATTTVLRRTDRFSTSATPNPDATVASAPTQPLLEIQRAIAGAESSGGPAAQTNKSLSIYHVSSAGRAADITRDVLHDAFADLENLLPEQIAVVSDDPRAIAPFLTTAFIGQNKAEALPVTVTGTNTRDTHAVIDAFLTALALAPTSFTLDAVFRMVALAPVTQGLGLGPEDVAQLRQACERAGLRSYIDLAHRQEVIGPGEQWDFCTWSATLRSLASSLAVPDGGNSVATAGDIVPAGNLQATQMPWLLALQRIIKTLKILRQLTGDSSLDAKLKSSRELCDLLFGYGPRSKAACESILAALDSIKVDAEAAGFTGHVDFFWLQSELSRRLNRVDTRTRVLHGGISLLRPSQVRCRTPRVTVLLLSEKFPVIDRPYWPDPFTNRRNVLTQNAKDQRDFLSCFTNTLERVICVVPSMCSRTRERLLMSPVIQDVRAAAESFSVSINETETSVVPHSFMALTGDLITRHTGAHKGSQALLQALKAGQQPQIFAVSDRHHPVPSEVTLDSFLDFFKDPLKAFLRHRGIYSQPINRRPEIREPLDPSSDYLGRYSIRRMLFDTYETLKVLSPSGQLPPLNTDVKNQVLCRLRAGGRLRSDVASETHYRKQLAGVNGLQEKWTAGSTQCVPINEVVSYTLHGSVHRLRIRGKVYWDGTTFTTYKIGSEKAKDFLRLAALESVLWEKAMLPASPGPAFSKTPQLVSISDESSKSSTSKSSTSKSSTSKSSTSKSSTSKSSKSSEDFTKRDTPHSHIPLQQLARLWHLGLQMPLPLFPAALGACLPPEHPASATNRCNLTKAHDEFYEKNPRRGSGEGHTIEVAQVFRGHDEPLMHCSCPPQSESDFERLAYFFSRGISDAYPMY